jgi:hypothetical protein
MQPKSGKPFVVRMIGEYHSYDDGLPLLSLKKKPITSQWRCEGHRICDRPSVGNDLNGDHVVRCFAVVHAIWKISKALTKDDWWK